MPAKCKINVGDRFNRLTILREVACDSRRQRMFLCKCDCGKIKTVRLGHLKSGAIKSCGCYAQDNAHNLFFKHGYRKHPLYILWKHIKARCYNPNNFAYSFYGGRGIGMCAEWATTPKSFVEWALKNEYRKGLTIDRINNNGNYEPTNCRWVSIIDQSNNRRDNVFYQFRGEQLTIPQICRKYGWWDRRYKFYYEVGRKGRDINEVITELVKENKY